MKDLNKILGIKPASESDVSREIQPTQVDDDFEFARTNLYNILSNGSTALERLIDIADQSQHPRAYEVLATMIKTLADTNKDLLELNKRIKDLKQQITPAGGAEPNVTNQNLFVGSTRELQDILLKLNKK